MTDKQMEEKREEFITTFPSIYEGLGTGGYLEIHDKVWQWIDELIKEVEKNIAERVEKELISIAEETKIDGEKPYYKGYKYVTLYNLLSNRMRECVYQKETN